MDHLNFLPVFRLEFHKFYKLYEAQILFETLLFLQFLLNHFDFFYQRK